MARREERPAWGGGNIQPAKLRLVREGTLQGRLEVGLGRTRRVHKLAAEAELFHAQILVLLTQIADEIDGVG